MLTSARRARQAILDLEAWQHRAQDDATVPSHRLPAAAPSGPEARVSGRTTKAASDMCEKACGGKQFNRLGAAATEVAKLPWPDKSSRDASTKMVRQMASAEALDRHFVEVGEDVWLDKLAEFLATTSLSNVDHAAQPAQTGSGLFDARSGTRMAHDGIRYFYQEFYCLLWTEPWPRLLDRGLFARDRSHKPASGRAANRSVWHLMGWCSGL